MYSPTPGTPRRASPPHGPRSITNISAGRSFHTLTLARKGSIVSYRTLSMHRTFVSDPPSTRPHSSRRFFVVTYLAWCRFGRRFRTAAFRTRAVVAPAAVCPPVAAAGGTTTGEQLVYAVSVSALCRFAMSRTGEAVGSYGDRGWEIEGCVGVL